MRAFSLGRKGSSRSTPMRGTKKENRISRPRLGAPPSTAEVSQSPSPCRPGGPFLLAPGTNPLESQETHSGASGGDLAAVSLRDWLHYRNVYTES